MSDKIEWAWERMEEERKREAPPPEREGLYAKYTVRDAAGNEVEDCFVLRPQKDPAARRALAAYAIWTKDSLLALQLMRWLRKLGWEDDKNGDE